MSFLSKVELKKQLRICGIKVEGNYVKKSDIKKVLATDSFDSLFEKPKVDDLAKAAFLVHRLPKVAKQNSKAGVTWAYVGTAILLGLNISKEDVRYLTQFIQAADDLGVKAHKEDINHLESLAVKELMKIDREGTLNLMKQAGISDRDYGPQT